MIATPSPETKAPSREATRFGRRGFLKSLGAGTVLAGVAGTPLLRNFAQAATGGGADAVKAMAGRWVASTCQGCTSWCPVQLRVIGNHVVNVRGMRAAA